MVGNPNGDTILIWMDRDQTPTATAFTIGSPSAIPSRHVDIAEAINEAMRIIAGGFSNGRQPWILSQGDMLGPNDIQIAHGRDTSHLTAMAHY